MSEPTVGQLLPSVFGHSNWKHVVRFVMAYELAVSVKIRQSCVIECYVKLGKNGDEILEMIRQAYGGETLGCAAVFQWWRHFKDGNMGVINKACSGMPSVVVMDVSIAKAMLLLFFIPLPVQLKSLLHGQEGCVFFSPH
jgi:hypothetical protein